MSVQRVTSLLCFLILATTGVLAQQYTRGDVYLEYHLGPSFSNLLNSEAPHKINVYNSDKYYVYAPSPDETDFPGYIDYQTSLVGDTRIGIATGIGVEYFLRSDFSIVSGLSLESKGITLRHSKETNLSPPGTGVKYEYLKLRISNHYLVLPLLARKYLKDQRFYVMCGLYSGLLLESRIESDREKTLTDESGGGSSYTSTFILKDNKKEYTTNVDIGFTTGIGMSKPLTKNLMFKVEVLTNIGIRTVDAKYNNEFQLFAAPAGGNSSNYLLRSTNYHGLNSDAKNINTTVNLGIRYKLNQSNQ